MDRGEYVHKRKKKYMAQVLEAFENDIEKHLPKSAAGAAQDFKGLIRMRLNALATDACDILELEGQEVNGAAVALKDQLSPVGRP